MTFLNIFSIGIIMNVQLKPVCAMAAILLWNIIELHFGSIRRIIKKIFEFDFVEYRNIRDTLMRSFVVCITFGRPNYFYTKCHTFFSFSQKIAYYVEISKHFASILSMYIWYFNIFYLFLGITLKVFHNKAVSYFSYFFLLFNWSASDTRHKYY